MNTFQDLVTVVEMGPLETALFCVLLTALLVITVWSVKTDVVGNFVGFDFSWAYILRRFRKHGGNTE